MATFPPPTAFGLPDKFTDWYPDQWDAITRALDSPCPAVGLNLPTGAGKSCINAALAALTIPKRTVLLTGTKGLQDQIAADFASMGLVDIRGQRAYPCLALLPGGDWSSLGGDPDGPDGPTGCDQGPCRTGLPCALRDHGCAYYDRVRSAVQSSLVCTNYAYWFAQKRFGQGLGTPDLVIADEAHTLVEELSQALQIKLDRWLCTTTKITPPDADASLLVWADWGAYTASRVGKLLDDLPTGMSKKELVYRRRLKDLVTITKSLATMKAGDWIADHTPDAYVFDLVYPAAYTQDLVYQGAAKLVLTSATITPHTFDELGIPAASREYLSYPSRFPILRRPVIYVPTVKVDYRMTPGDVYALVQRVDQIIDRWPTEKGIIHTVSFARAKVIADRSRHKARMIVPTNGQGTKAAVADYLNRPGPWVLVSPSLTTGWDFPGPTCRFQIVVKLPFPSTQSKTLQARAEKDPLYVPNLMAQTLVQAVGRGMRSASDWCVTYLLDDNWRWAQKKYKDLFPVWFLDAVKWATTIPERASWMHD